MISNMVIAESLTLTQPFENLSLHFEHLNPHELVNSILFELGKIETPLYSNHQKHVVDFAEYRCKSLS